MLGAGEEAGCHDAQLWRACLCRAGDAAGNARLIGQVEISGLPGKAKNGPFSLRFPNVGKSCADAA
jgi:hypothetical protein